MNKYYKGDVVFDKRTGAHNSLEQAKTTTTQSNYFIDTAPHVEIENHWITAVYKYGEYIILEEFDGTHITAQKKHNDWLGSIKKNGYKINKMLTAVKKEIEREMSNRIIPSRFLTVRG